MGNVVLNAVLEDFDIYQERAEEHLKDATTKESRSYWTGYIDAIKSAKTTAIILLWTDD